MKIESLIVPIVLTSFLTVSGFAFSHDDHESCEPERYDKVKKGEFFQKRQIELHDNLALTSAQEQAWNNFVEKTKPNGINKKEDWSEISKLSTPERLDHMLSKSKEHEEQVEKRIYATKEFYNQLTTSQQKTFDASFQHRGHREHEGDDKHN